ncbi:alanine dehydrogenase [Psychromonas aquimarina]|uniref:alanine dehydrogenase n=1 Tax=Psychromonas aquimarina TaxID=444919 RepID=UPI0004155CE8|nr:alanine dehydrogenase [Psychromonas aquimarina]
MIIGVPKEIKNNEYRVGLVPSSVAELNAHGHKLVIEKNAGAEIGFADQDYIDAGAEICADARTVFEQAEMIIKVKEPQQQECAMLRPEQILFTYLHLAPDLNQTQALIKSGAVCIAYETVTDNNGQLPLLRPMSEVAGRMSIQAGAHALQKSNGGSGLLLAGVPGVAPANVVILGGGIVGSNAARMALGLGADVVILDKNINTLRRIDEQFCGRINTVYSSGESLKKYVVNADLVIGAVLIPGAAAPKLVSRKLIKQMKKGSAVVDVAIDQGGCFATSHATTHQDPTYIVDGIVHYCVANMPGDVALTAAQALNNVTLPYILKLADLGYRQALKQDKHLLNGLNICAGKVTIKEVAKAHGLNFSDPQQLI